MKKVVRLSIILLIVVVASSCKKKNLTKDQWYISSAIDLQDGSNITSDFTGEIWEYDKDGTYLENGTIKGTWAFSDGKDNLVITKLDNSIDSYKILKINRKEMWLEELGEEELHLSKY